MVSEQSKAYNISKTVTFLWYPFIAHGLYGLMVITLAASSVSDGLDFPVGALFSCLEDLCALYDFGTAVVLVVAVVVIVSGVEVRRGLYDLPGLGGIVGEGFGGLRDARAHGTEFLCCGEGREGEGEQFVSHVCKRLKGSQWK